MQNYNLQQQAIILKVIANQLLSMAVPSFEELNKMVNSFGYTIISNEESQQKYHAEMLAVINWWKQRPVEASPKLNAVKEIRTRFGRDGDTPYSPAFGLKEAKEFVDKNW